MAENPVSHKCDMAKGITIGSTFLAKAGYSSFNEIQKFVEYSELNFLFRKSSQVN